MTSADDVGRLVRARARVETFDDMIRGVLEEQYRRNFGASAEHLLRNETLLRWDLRELMDRYAEAAAYPHDRLAGLADRAIDFKLQFRFVNMNLGIQNQLVYGAGFDPRKPLATPVAHLWHLSLLQSLIGQVRVLWERLMTLVYYLEMGHDPRGKSIRRVFFNDIAHWSPRWDVLREWEPVIARYDSDFRTPEFHNRSRMRRELFGEPSTDPNDIMAPLTPVMNGFWEVLLANVQGQQSHVSRLGYNVSSGLDDWGDDE